MVNKFISFMKMTSSQKRSGWNDADYHQRAKELFHESTKKEFQLDHCYFILQQMEKFKTEPAVSEKRLAGADKFLSPEPTGDSQITTFSRPIGRKKAKRLAFGSPDEEMRQAKLARIKAQTEAANASADKDRSISEDLSEFRSMLKRDVPAV